MDGCASFGIRQVINVTGLVFQEDAGSRNILGGEEKVFPREEMGVGDDEY
jgi:hypothetical protein